MPVKEVSVTMKLYWSPSETNVMETPDQVKTFVEATIEGKSVTCRVTSVGGIKTQG